MTGTINFDQIRQYANTIRQRETAQATGTIFGQAGTPDQAVEALTLGRELSLPPAAILAQPDRFRSEVAMQRATALLENSPALQQWIVSDPLNGQLASDDLDPLAGYEAFVARAEESLGDLFTRRGQEVVQGVSGVIEAVPMRRAINAVALERRIIEQADAWVAEAGRQAQSFREILEAGLDPMSGTPLTEEDRALYEQRLAEAEEGLQNWTDMAESGVMPIEMRTMMQISQSISDWVDDTFGVPPADDSIWSQLAYGTGSMIGFALPSMLPGGVIATAQLGADAAATEAYQRAIQSGASERDAEVAANIMGFLGTSEALPIASALRAIPSPLRNRVIGRIGRVISESAVGSIEEAVQEGFTAVAQNLTARGLYDPEQGIMEDVGAQMLVGAILGGFMSGGFELVSPGPSDGPLSPELQRMQNTGRTAAHLEALDAQVGAVATRERSPERFEQFAAEAGGDRDLYVPAEELRVYAQDANLDLDRLGVDAVEMDTMAQTGGMVAIPEARYAAYVSGTDAAQWFHENSVLNPDTEMSLAQQAAIGRSLTDAAMEDARRIREGDRQLRTSDQQVFDRVRAQLREAGRSPDVAENEATFFAAFFRTMAERYGADTLELYQRFGVRIERATGEQEATTEGQTLEQGGQDGRRIGYRVVNVDADGNIVSQADSRTVLSPNVGEAQDVAMWVAPDIGYVIDNYSNGVWGDGEPMQALAEYEFTDDQIIDGNWTDAQSEASIRGGTLRALTPLSDEAVEELLARQTSDPRVLFQDGYRGLHTAPMAGDGNASLADLTDVFGDDIYGPNAVRHYGTGNDRMDAETIRIIKSAAENPDRPVAIYRAVPSGVSGRINSGDWVTINLEYAQQHGEYFDGFDILVMQALPHQIITDGNSIHEFGYDPQAPRVLNQSATDLNQDDGSDAPRGQISIPAGGVEGGTTVIKLFDGADLSTVLHESGHYFYEVFSTLAADERAPQAMKDDFAALQAWMGVEEGKPPSREALETFARGIERYTLEGKAPSVELAPVFQRFKAWLMRVYQTVKQRNLGVKLTPEVRDIFDRMLATDAEIAQARDLAGDSALLKSAPPGMSEATWAAYQRLQRQKVERAEQTLLERTMAAVRRRKEAWWKDERATRVQDEMDRLGNQPEYRVIRAFADGDWAGVEGAVEGADLRLDRAALEEMFGEGITNDLAPAKFGMSRAIYTTAKHPDGMHPSEAAELFGFTSASEMIDALRGAGNRRAIAEATVDQAMAQEYGDPFADGSIEAEALDAVHNDRKGEAMALELRYIAERLGRDGRREQTASFKARARAIIGGLTVQQATKPAHFLQAERQASRRAQEAFAAGRLEEAYQAKEQEALNHYLFVEATKVEKLVARKREQMRNYDRADVRQKVGPREMEQIDAILQDYEFRKRTQRALDRTMSLRQYIEKMTEEGREAELMLDADLLDEVRRQHYSRLSVDELMAVFDAVDNLDNLGRTKTDIRNGLDKIKLRKAAATVAQQIRDNFGTGRRGKESRLRSTMNLLWTADTILVEMDGTDEYGEAYRLIKEALDAGQSREQQMHVELAQRLEDLFSVYSQEDLTEMRKQRHVSGADARAWSKLEIISLALNMGNADNIQRVLSEDINKDFRLNRDQVDALLDTLDKRDWDFVQSMWDQIDSYWPEIQAVTTRRTGVKPRKVEATPVQTRFGVYRGGYYPIAYDPSSSGRSSVDAVTATDQFMSAGRYGKAQTAHGHTIARKQNSNGRALLFDLNVAFRHMRDVVRDIALSEAVDGAYRILNDEEVHSAFIEAGRENDFRVLNLWLKDLARGPIYNTDSLNSAARFIKNNFTLSRLAFNLKTAILQITGIGQSAATVGKRAMVEGYAEYLKRPHEMAQEVTQLSPFMAERQSTFQKDIYDFANDVKLASPLASRWHKTKNKVSQWGFAPMMWAQFYAVDMPTWIAGYRSGLERFGNEEQAVRYADRMVARSQDSGLFGDRAAMSRGTMSETTRQSDFIRLFTTLAGYMMTKLNRANLTVRRGVKGMREGATIEEQASAAFNMAADLALLYVTEAAMMALMYSLILDDEDEPDYAAFFGREVSAAIFGGLPFVRDAAAAFTGFGGGGVYGSVGELPYRVWQQTVNQDWENDAALRRAIGDLVGTTTGLPTTASLRLIEGVVNEDDRPFAEALVGRNQLTR